MTIDKAIAHCEGVADLCAVTDGNIPKGTTNKDIFKAVFGYEPAIDAVVCNKEDWCGASEPCNYCISNSNNIGRSEDWWNAPYKSESEGEE